MPKRRTKGEGSLSQRHDSPTCPPLNPDGTRPKHEREDDWELTPAEEAEFRDAMASRHLAVVPDLEQTWTCRRCGGRYSFDASERIAEWEMEFLHDCPKAHA